MREGGVFCERKGVGSAEGARVCEGGQCQAVTKRLIALHFCLNRKFKCPVKCKEGSKVPKWMKNVMVDDLADCKGKASSMAKDQVCKTVPSLQSQHKKMHPLPPRAVELG